MATQAEIESLIGAVWQILDDMREHGTGCCLAAKAALRVAFEPFKQCNDDVRDFMSLAEAHRIIRECENWPQ